MTAVRRGMATLGLAVLVAVLAVGPAAKPAGAATQISGVGSTWSAIAIRAWIADVSKFGLPVNYNDLGSTAGRTYYIQNQADFAVSEIPFQGVTKDALGNPVGSELEGAAKRPYAYLPIVAGGTSFMYHLDLRGKRVTNLKLSGATIGKIFTGVITNWNDPAITADDGRKFPSKTIKPIVRSDGSGTSAQFSTYLNTVYRPIWQAFCRKTNLTPCGFTSLYPIFEGAQGQSGSDGVSGAVAAPYNDGAITYVEYGYAKQKGFPVVSVKNQAGYFTQPTAGNVAVALTRATIKADRTQVLTNVYTNPDPRTYPVSSYSYMIVPTTEASIFTKAKGATLGAFINYFLCEGQQKAEILGYSPLPTNLVQYGFEAVRKIPGAPAPPALAACKNPAVQGQFSVANAPAPPSGSNKPNVADAGGGGRIGGGAATTLPSSATTLPGGATDTGSGAADDTAGGTEEATAAEAAALQPVSVTKGEDEVPVGIYGLVAVLVLIAVFAPPGLSLFLRRRRS